MNALEKIIAYKRTEVAERKALYPTPLLEKSIYFSTPTVSLRSYLNRTDQAGIIAEFKRKSPSKGELNPYATPEQVCLGYMQAGASALSVLTDSHFFGGKNEDLTTARRMNFCPILRKDFVVEEYQIIEARSLGADVVLLIAAVLTPEEIRKLARLAAELGMEVLLEIHDEAELETSLGPDIHLVGVNNRNLKDMTISLEPSLALADKIPAEFTKVAESGLSNPAQVVRLREVGYQGFLIGHQFMEAPRPEKACAAFIQELRKLSPTASTT
jgi:indole-3-glycerol phosphate synthase